MSIEQRVFTLDDDPVFNEMVKAILRKFGLKSETFSSTADFSERLAKSLPQLALLDLNLAGGEKTYDLIREIRSRYEKKFPIFVVSSETQPQSIAHAIECGANDYVLKPLNREIFAAKLLSYLKNPELLDVQMGFSSAPPSTLRATLSVSCQIAEVDELGIRIVSPHLITKGSVISLKSLLFHQWTGQERSILVTATATSVDDEGHFSAYCEFDPTDEELGSKVRNWLGQR